MIKQEKMNNKVGKQVLQRKEAGMINEVWQELKSYSDDKLYKICLFF